MPQDSAMKSVTYSIRAELHSRQSEKMPPEISDAGG